MNKYPFTQTGFESLQSALYQLSDQQLKIEADLLRSNFKAWVADHLELTESQIDDLNQISQPASEFYSYIIGFAFENRLPVNLNKAEKGEFQVYGSKLIRPTSYLTGTTDSQGTFTAGGYVDIDITY